LRREPRLLLDENIGVRIAPQLRELGYQVQSVFERARGLPDVDAVKWAKREEKIVVTMDKDFGYLAQSHRVPV
jgi:predicted nuclease of predicted toxin-antitoxin system